MNLKMEQFSKQALAMMPGFARHKSFFYWRTFGHVINGFCCEVTPNGAYVWRLIYPLFDPNEALHLTYSSRLAGANGYISFDCVPKDRLAEKFVESVRDFLPDARREIDVSEFLSYCENQSLQRNAHIKMNMGYAMILVGDERAAGYLRSAAKEVREPFKRTCESILRYVEHDLDEAKRAVLELELGMRRILTIDW